VRVRSPSPLFLSFMPAFDLVVVGSGGGPSETNISGYLLKTRESSWQDGIIALEAGSGLGALQRILQSKPDLFQPTGEIGDTSMRSAAKVYSFVQSFLITHAHLDHVMGLILLAGGIQGCRKSIRGSKQVLEDLESVFRPSRIWPNLASWDSKDSDHMYLYDALNPDAGYSTIARDISVRMMPLSHGGHPVPYESTAFFIRHDPSLQEFIFFGDVEPDSISSNPMTKNVWREAASKIPHRINTIFIECSWPLGREDSALYGHLDPNHLAQELENLAKEVASHKKASATNTAAAPARKRQKVTPTSSGGIDLSGSLDGLRVFITHCKEDMESIHDRPMHVIITEQVRRLMDDKKLGVTILSADQGGLIEI